MLNEYTVIDLETTGLSPLQDKIIEIAAIKIRNGQCMDQFETLVNPNMAVDEKIQELTGINREMLVKAPYINEVMQKLWNFINEDVLVGHNIMFDYSFLMQETYQLGVDLSPLQDKCSIDTLKLARKYCAEQKSKKLVDLCKNFQIQDLNHHRALNDAFITHQLYCKLCEKYESSHTFPLEHLFYKPQKVKMATKKQKQFLSNLLLYHGLHSALDMDKMTQNEISRYSDKIISKYGRMK